MKTHNILNSETRDFISFICSYISSAEHDVWLTEDFQ